MNKYTIKYANNGREITIARTADTAENAIIKLCDQYGWRGRLHQYDADTRGREWAEVFADPEGGINFSIRIIAVKQ